MSLRSGWSRKAQSSSKGPSGVERRRLPSSKQGAHCTCRTRRKRANKTAIRTSDTRHLSDPAIAAAALGAGPKDLINDLNTFGFLFESLCVRDLRVYAQALGGDVYHYRDKRGLECDAVVPHGAHGRRGLQLPPRRRRARGAHCDFGRLAAFGLRRLRRWLRGACSSWTSRACIRSSTATGA